MQSATAPPVVLSRSLAQKPSPSGTTPASTVRWRRFLLPIVSIFIFSGLAVAGLVYRSELSELFQPPKPALANSRIEPVGVVGPNLIAVTADTWLVKHLQVACAATDIVEYPVLNASGYVTPRRRATARLEGRERRRARRLELAVIRMGSENDDAQFAVIAGGWSGYSAGGERGCQQQDTGKGNQPHTSSQQTPS